MTAYPNPAGERDPRQLELPFEDGAERDVIEVFGEWEDGAADVSGDGGCP